MVTVSNEFSSILTFNVNISTTTCVLVENIYICSFLLPCAAAKKKITRETSIFFIPVLGIKIVLPETSQLPSKDYQSRFTGN